MLDFPFSLRVLSEIPLCCWMHFHCLIHAQGAVARISMRCITERMGECTDGSDSFHDPVKPQAGGVLVLTPTPGGEAVAKKNRPIEVLTTEFSIAMVVATASPGARLPRVLRSRRPTAGREASGWQSFSLDMPFICSCHRLCIVCRAAKGLRVRPGIIFRGDSWLTDHAATESCG